MTHLTPPRQLPTSPNLADRWSSVDASVASASGRDGAPVDIAQLLGTLRRHAWLVIVAMVAAGGLAWYVVRSRPQVYSARATVQLADAREELTSGLVGRDQDQTTYGTSVLSQIEVLKSRAVAAQVVDSEPLGLRVQTAGFPISLLSSAQITDSAASGVVSLTFTDAGFIMGGDSAVVVPYGAVASAAGIRFAVARRPSAASGTVRVLSRDRAIDYLLMNLDASPRKNTTLIDITYAAASPATAMYVANRVARAYQAVNAHMAQEQVRRRRIFIEQQLARYDSLLAQAQNALSTFRTQQQAYSSQEKFDARQTGLRDLQSQEQQLDNERALSVDVLHIMQQSDPDKRRQGFRMLASSESMGKDPAVSRLYDQLVGYQTQRAELTSGPSAQSKSNPDVQRVDTLIADTEQRLVGAVQAHIALLDARIASLTQLEQENAHALRQLPDAEIKETRLTQNVQTLGQQKTLLQEEYQHARIAEAAEVGQVEILDLASHAFAVPSQGTRVILFAVFLGLMVGGGGAVLVETIDTTVKRREDFELRLGVPVLATIPQLEVAAGPRIPLPVSRAERLRRDTEKRRSVALASAQQRRSPNSEAYRQLRTNIFYGYDDQRLHTLVVTSPLEGDGKTSVAVNLAISLAHQGRRVLLIDCDLHNPKLQRIFQLATAPGLGEVILQGVSPVEAIRATETDGLFVMTAGALPPEAGEPMGSTRMRAMLSDLARQFDAIILDCAPVLAVSDSAILGVDVDGVLLVVRAGSTTPPDAAEALRNLSTAGAHVVGAVLNDPDGRVKRYGGYCYGYPRK